MVSSFSSIALADSNSDAFDLRHVSTEPSEYYFTILDPEGSPYSSLVLQPPGVEIGGDRGDWKSCVGPNDPVCLEDPGARTAFLALGLCENALDEDCVADLQVSRNGGPMESAQFIRRIESNLVLDADPSTGFPGGSTATLWQEAQDPTKKYLVLASYGGGFWSQNFYLNSMSFNVVPVREANGNYQGARIDPSLDPCCRVSFGSDYRAMWTEDGRAGFRVDFDANVDLKLTTRVRKSFSGWFKGRIKDPSVKLSEFSPANDLLEIQGTPVSVAVMGVKRKVSEMSPREYNWFQNNGTVNATSPTRPDANDVFEFIDHFRSEAKDTALGLSTAWSIGSTIWGNENSCLNDKTRLVGIVSTNSMGFDGSSPKFIDGALEYRVSSLHLGPDGETPLQGTYDLLLRSDVARCLYGFSKAPISASITVVGEAGNSTTTVSRMTESDGWVKFGAYGFTYSEKKIRVAISQEEVKGSEPEVVEKAAPSKRPSLLCHKGKKTAKISPSGKCPKGYKKK